MSGAVTAAQPLCWHRDTAGPSLSSKLSAESFIPVCVSVHWGALLPLCMSHTGCSEHVQLTPEAQGHFPISGAAFLLPFTNLVRSNFVDKPQLQFIICLSVALWARIPPLNAFPWLTVCVSGQREELMLRCAGSCGPLCPQGCWRSLTQSNCLISRLHVVSGFDCPAFSFPFLKRDTK